MDDKLPFSLNLYFFFFVLLIITYLFIRVIWPFFFAILLGAIITGLFYPLYKLLLRATRGRASLSSVLSCLAILLLLILPLAGLLAVIAGQALEFYSKVDGYVRSVPIDVNRLAEWFRAGGLLDEYQLDEAQLFNKLGEIAKAISTFLIKSIQSVTQGAINVIAMLFVMLFSMYYFFKDGPAFLERFKRMSPLDDEHEDRLISKFASITRATIKGTLVIAIIQGGIGGIAFWIFGVPSPLFWGLIMVILSIIPAIGSGIVWLPAGIILIVNGRVGAGFGILAIGAGLISTIDNLLRPRLVGKDTEMHPLLIFLGTLGGISVFGIVGFIIGPIIAALFVTIWDIYATEFEV
ncbi:MAG: AI-2E family transporter [Candidatus Glassbacteria bacterium]